VGWWDGISPAGREVREDCAVTEIAMVSELVRALRERYCDPQLHPLVHEAIREIWRLEAWQKRALEENTPYFARDDGGASV